MSSENDKNETSRFLGEGMSFKAKLIGILEVSEARGDRMCQEALSDLKIAIRAAGEHKQRIVINVAIDGLRLRDEKTGDSLYHHPVHKISFIAQDMTDSRAFGYIFGSPDTGHRFFGIKTDKAASQVVIAMRDLFQVVFALKKKEIELAKQSLEKNYCFNRDNSNAISESAILESKDSISDPSTKSSSELKSGPQSSENKPSAPVVANLVDLEIELTNLQQGISQIERLTPSDPFSSNDPFGDSFISYTPKPILPPPPSGRERSGRTSDTSNSSSCKNQVASKAGTKGPPSSSQALSMFQSPDDLSLIKSQNGTKEESFTDDWFISSVPAANSFKDTLIQPQASNDPSISNDTQSRPDVTKQFDVFTELDPLGTGKIKPYVHKRDFFQELKKPKKVLNDLVNNKQTYNGSNSTVTTFKTKNLTFKTDPFGEDPFVKSDPFADKDPFGKDNFNVDFAILDKEQKASDFVDGINFSSLDEESTTGTQKINSSSKLLVSEEYKKLSPENDFVPKPPPRPTNTLQTQPPPLPPKKQPGDLCLKPPPRPPHLTEEIHYDVLPREIEKDNPLDEKGPPLPAPARKTKPTLVSFDSSQQKKKLSAESSEDDYLTPIPFPQQKEFNFSQKSTDEDVLVPSSIQKKDVLEKKTLSVLRNNTNVANLNVMLSQLTLSDLNDLAVELNIPTSELSNMTLAQITTYLSDIIIKKQSEENSESKEFEVENSSSSKTNFADFSNFNNNTEETHDKYAVFRELEATEFKVSEESNPSPVEKNVTFFTQQSTEDKYAALREITEAEDITRHETNLIFNESFECVAEKEEKQIEDDKSQQSSSDDKKDSPKKNDIIIEHSTDDVFEEEKLQAYDSASEGASNTSPEVDVTAEATKEMNNAPGKNWAIFDQVKSQTGEKLSLQSEEGVSPWSSDSKEFGNAPDSGSENWGKQSSFKDQDKWWDTSAEPEAEYYRPNRRSTDSFDEEYCNYSKTLPNSRKKQGSGASPGSQAAGGHSSSSRDISPWEEEAYTLTPTQRKNVRTSDGWERHSRQYFEKCRDSWDEEDDYEYDEEQYGRYCWPDRRGGGRQMEKGGYRDRNKGWIKDHWSNERHFWKQEVERKRRCCEDWDPGKSSRYYGSGKRPSEGLCPHKWSSDYEDPHFLRDSQDSSWEEDYHQRNSPEMQPPSSSHYLNLKHRWKRPSSASEVEKNTDEIRNKQLQYYIGTGGSDGEKERRYKGNRRSRSRDTYCCEMNVHHKTDPNYTLRSYHKTRVHPQHNPSFNGESQDVIFPKTEDYPNKTITSRKKGAREEDKSTNYPSPGANPHWNVNYTGGKFENNFVDDGGNDSPTPPPHGRCNFEYEPKITDMCKPPPMRRPMKMIKPKGQNVRGPSPGSIKNKRLVHQSTEHGVNVSRRTQRSPFEDDFSPPPPTPPSHVTSTKVPLNNEMEPTENDLKNEEEDYFSPEITEKRSSLSKRLGNFESDDGLKKSESVNIFVRENDPFDDDFFSENAVDDLSEYADSPKNTR